MYETEQEIEKVILVAVCSNPNQDPEESLDELEELVKTAGATVVGRMIQNLEHASSATYIGSGKVEELKDLIWKTEATAVVCDDELTPAQYKNLEDELDVKVMDRTLIILDIFAGRAKTAEGKIQVELAQLRYRSTRLIGMRNLSRQGGGIGTRGPGEKKLETDRRHIERRMNDIKSELSQLKSTRNTQRARREKNHIPVVALVGYTNSGKSAIMNRILSMSGKADKNVFEENMLFATLDTQQRSVDMENGHKFILIDTVGFVSKLPHSLIEAFKATLEEVTYADLLLHVVDSSYDNHDFHIEVTDKVMKEVGAGNKEKIMVFNKCDLPHEHIVPEIGVENIEISAKTGYNLELLLQKVEEKLFGDYMYSKMLIPFNRGDISSYLCSEADVKMMEYKADGTYFELKMKKSDYQRFKEYEIV